MVHAPVSKTKVEVKKSTGPTGTLSGLFSSIGDESPQAHPTFVLKGDLGKLLGNLERYELAITLDGEQGAGKTRLTYQIADAFADLGHTVAMFSLEIGKASDLVKRMREDYISISNENRILIADKAPKGIDTIREAAKQFDVVMVDSWTKLEVDSSEFDRLRKDFPNTMFVIIFQRTVTGTIRGGTRPIFDAGIVLKVVKGKTFSENYAYCDKNRYGATGIRYSVANQSLID